MEDLLNSETSRNTVTSFNDDDADSEERFKEPQLIEEEDDDDDDDNDDDCNYIPPPKCNKHHKVHAFRDFPEGCGPYASRVVVLDDAGVARTKEAAKFGKDAAKVVTRKRKRKKCFYYRKRVHAVRDFPPLCGENASHLSEGDESLKGLVEKNVQDGHAHSGRVMDIVEGDSEGNGVEKEEKLSVFGSCIAIPEESNKDQVEVNSETVLEGNQDAVEFAGTSRKEILVLWELQGLWGKDFGYVWLSTRVEWLKVFCDVKSLSR